MRCGLIGTRTHHMTSHTLMRARCPLIPPPSPTSLLSSLLSCLPRAIGDVSVCVCVCGGGGGAPLGTHTQRERKPDRALHCV
ncbi:hypothetical protein, conserved [Leishmania donovani]|uniref:Uncharacterized protein n=1 Tax=Leishmania donovani TaxID=5661 RepID=E9BEP0_LEIDO|nr:hypothetical protein, conserved [Leishmania donovani]CBZ33726.1 hypothetical protein, conserved [Leishmania donovani]